MGNYSEPEIKYVTPLNPTLSYSLGLLNMFLIKLKRLIIPYAKIAKTRSLSNIQDSVQYSIDVVDQWLKVARIYTNKEEPFLGASILEIGPGPDLGNGLILLALGAHSYCAIDLFPFNKDAPPAFYDILLDKIKNYQYESLACQHYETFKEKGFSLKFDFIQVPFPSLEGLSPHKFDFIMSNMVWEHIVDLEATLSNLITAAKPGAIFINKVDLETHGRLRKLDPLNILRYDNRIYQVLKGVETPNRLRGSDLMQASIKLGLKEAKIIPLKKVNRDYLEVVYPNLSPPFRQKAEEDLEILECWWLAAFPGRHEKE